MITQLHMISMLRPQSHESLVVPLSDLSLLINELPEFKQERFLLQGMLAHLSGVALWVWSHPYQVHCFLADHLHRRTKLLVSVII